MTAADSTADDERVRTLLGREPQARFEIVVRQPDGDPIVIRNEAFLADGTPLPTRYWLVDPALNLAVSRLEAAGGVRNAQAAVDPHALELTHRRYAAERDATIATTYEGPRPHGGVGGTRTGVKCLHAHLAYRLAGGDDPVGEWVEQQLTAVEVVRP